MKKILSIVLISLLLSGNVYSKSTNLSCKLNKDDKPFMVLLDNENNNATFQDEVVKAVFSAVAVKFIAATIEQNKGILVVMDYEVSRVNLDITQTITLTVPGTPEIDDKTISKDSGKCVLLEPIKIKF